MKVEKGKKLKACPFCGGKAKVFKENATVLFTARYSVACEKINCDVVTLEKRTKKEAIKAWNKRTLEEL